jgi:hypothetical protein
VALARAALEREAQRAGRDAAVALARKELAACDVALDAELVVELRQWAGP